VQKNLTIIIVSFNSAQIIKSCLDRINFSRYEAILIDNNSSDNTTQIVQEKFPQVKLIKNHKNIGYGRANNIGLRLVETDFAMILNPDAFISEKDIELVLEKMIANPKIALAGPLLLPSHPATEDKKSKQLKIAEGNLLENFLEYLSVKYIIGAILFFKMSVFQQIGFFDEDIFLYYEDDEISWRVIKSGYTAAIVPSAQGFHIGHGSSGGKLRNIYKRFWHRALSKLYWKKKQKGKLMAMKSAIRLVIVFFIKSFLYLITLQPKKMVENFASFCGSFSFLIGLKAFDKNDNPRA
jgi:N-acetylglucosaminyl-diphospho-decaprenol L-rhamnosyltransferase